MLSQAQGRIFGKLKEENFFNPKEEVMSEWGEGKQFSQKKIRD